MKEEFLYNYAQQGDAKVLLELANRSGTIRMEGKIKHDEEKDTFLFVPKRPSEMSIEFKPISSYTVQLGLSPVPIISFAF